MYGAAGPDSRTDDHGRGALGRGTRRPLRSTDFVAVHEGRGREAHGADRVGEGEPGTRGQAGCSGAHESSRAYPDRGARGGSGDVARERLDAKLQACVLVRK